MSSSVSPATLFLTALCAFLAATNPLLFTFFTWAHTHWGLGKFKNVFASSFSKHGIRSSFSFLPKQGTRAIPYIRGLPWFGCVDFFSRRNDFIQECLHRVQDNLCEIQLPKCRAFIVSSDQVHHAFFHNKHMSLEHGYGLLLGSKSDFRQIKGIPASDGGAEYSFFLSRFATIMRPDALSRRYPVAIEDIDTAHRAMGNSGTLDAFRMSYDLTLQLAVRTVCPSDIAGDPVHIQCIGSLLSVVTEDPTSLSFLFPWLSVTKHIKTAYHGQRLWRTLRSAIKRREGEAIDDTDCISFMMEKGDNLEQMISFIIGAVVLGLLNTSRVHAWLLIYLHFNPEWKTKVVQEMNDLLVAHSATPENLHSIPFPAWESALPSLESCTSEIIRLLGDTSLLRKNMGGEINIAGRTLPAQSFLIYPISVPHLDPDFFPDPLKFDPSRVAHKNPHFVGWGVGRHPCSGKKTALMLLKLMTTHFLLRFNYDLVDRSGNALKSVPQRERNTLHMPESAKGEEVFIKYTSVSNFGSAI